MYILLITNFFPPANTIASHRTFSFAKYLPEFGIDVDVFTPQREGSLNFNLDDITIIHPYTDHSPVNSFAKSNLLKSFFKYTGMRPIVHYYKNKILKESIRFLNNKELKKYDAIMVSFGPEGVLRLGFFLSKKYNIPLIIDYRDLWYDVLSFRPTLVDTLTISLLEKRIIGMASLVIATSKTAASELKRQYGKEVAVIYNGYFDDIPYKGHSIKLQDDSRFVDICYCGSLYNGVRPIEMVFPALVRNKHFRLHVALFDESDCHYIENLLKKNNVMEQVVVYKNLTNDESISLQRECDVLLFLNKLDGSLKRNIAAKLYEYMSSGKYILGIGHRDDEAREIIENYNLGAYTDSSHEVESLIEDSIHWKRVPVKDTAFFTRRNQAMILSERILELFQQN